jgi:hypothetical protein
LHTLSISSPFSGSNGCFLIDFGLCFLAEFRGKGLSLAVNAKGCHLIRYDIALPQLMFLHSYVHVCALVRQADETLLRLRHLMS